MAKVALAIDMLMAANLNREEAAREVVKKLHKYEVPIKGRIDIQEWKTVLGWREDLAKAGRHAGPEKPEWDWYGGMYLLEKEGRLRLVEEGGADPKAEAMRQLDLVRSSPPSVG